MMRPSVRLAMPLVVLVFLLRGCPSSSDLDHMAKASNELAHDVKVANEVVAEFYKAGRIPLPAKDKIADKLGIIGDKGKAFNDILIELDKRYPQGTLPPQDLAFVRQNLSQLRSLYTDIIADLLPFSAQNAVSKLDEHLKTIEGVVK